MRRLENYKPKHMAEGSHYDKARADRAVNFVENLTHVKGQWAGDKFELIDWQEQILRDLFGIVVSYENGKVKRQHRQSYTEIPKKAGKSALISALALYMTCADGEYAAETYVAAADRQQASIIFDTSVMMVENCPALKKRIKPILSQKRLVYKPTNSIYTAVSSETYSKNGLNISCLIIDELMAQKDRGLWNVMTHGSSDARQEPLFFYITTAGFDRHSICYEQHEKAKGILSGQRIDPAYYPTIFAADDGMDWRDEKTWEKANPSLDITVDREKLRADCIEAEHNIAEQNLFRMYRLNQWVEQNVRWLDMGEYDQCAFEFDIEALRGRSCYAGLDLSSTTDITSIVLLFPPLDEEDKYRVVPFFFIPSENIEKRSKRDHVPYSVWRQKGLLQVSEGNVIDYRLIENFMLELSSRFQILQCGYDEWQAQGIVRTLTDEGITMVPVRMGHRSLHEPTTELMRLVLSRKIAHNGNEILRWMAGNLVVRLDANGNIAPDKSKATEKIDGIVALILALSRAMRYEGTTESIYNSAEREGGLLVL